MHRGREVGADAASVSDGTPRAGPPRPVTSVTSCHGLRDAMSRTTRRGSRNGQSSDQLFREPVKLGVMVRAPPC